MGRRCSWPCNLIEEKKEVTFLTALKEEEGLCGEGNVSKEVLEVLDTFIEAMFDRFSQTFSP